MMRTLKPGTRYVVKNLVHQGWNGLERHEGYYCLDYFELDGTYRGPDYFGVEPVWGDGDENNKESEISEAHDPVVICDKS